MTKDQHDEWRTRSDLHSANWQVTKEDSIKFNHGSETFRHLACKTAAGWVLRDRGYRVDSEVVCPGGEVDVLGYKRDDILVVECETSPSEGVVADKLERYVYGEPPRDMIVLDVGELPEEFMGALKWVDEQI